MVCRRQHGVELLLSQQHVDITVAETVGCLDSVISEAILVVGELEE